MKERSEISFEIKEVLEKLSDKSSSGWIKLFTLTKWGDNAEAYDIRNWHYPEGSNKPDKCSKGITLSYDELAMIGSYLSEHGIF